MREGKARVISQERQAAVPIALTLFVAGRIMLDCFYRRPELIAQISRPIRHRKSQLLNKQKPPPHNRFAVSGPFNN